MLSADPKGLPGLENDQLPIPRMITLIILGIELFISISALYSIYLSISITISPKIFQNDHLLTLHGAK